MDSKDIRREDLTELYDILTSKSKSVFISKNKEYSKDSNPFSNFEESAKRADCNPGQSWIMYFEKHYDAICSYILNKKTYSDETVEGRIVDMINYLVLLYGMIKSERL